MIFSVPVEIPASKIRQVTLKLADGELQTTIKLEGVMTPDVAGALSCLSVLYAEEAPRGGFDVVKLDVVGPAASFKLVPYKLERNVLRLTIERTDSFVVTAAGASGFNVEYKIHYRGPLFDVLEYLGVIADGPATAVIEPLQRDLVARDEVARRIADSAESHRRVDDLVKQGSLANVVMDAVIDGLSASVKGIPTDPNVPEWRTADEIADGVPHHIAESETTVTLSVGGKSVTMPNKQFVAAAKRIGKGRVR